MLRTATLYALAPYVTPHAPDRVLLPFSVIALLSVARVLLAGEAGLA